MEVSHAIMGRAGMDCEFLLAIEQPVGAVRGLSQGDSCAPSAMVVTLMPWRPAGKSWAFMNDRSSVTAAGPQ